jgi:hypothetical protein
MWPESSGMTNAPSSSVTTTAGSAVLFRTNGAIARTAMPQAPTNTTRVGGGELRAVEGAAVSRNG